MMTSEETWEPRMRSAERRRLRAVLEARPRALLTDVDGTISAIAPTPDAAVLLPGVRESLIEACQVFSLVGAISGRSAPDASRLVDVPCLWYIGNHGMEQMAPRDPAEAAETDTRPGALTIMPEARRSMPAITSALDHIERTLVTRFPGMLVERKGVTGSIHYRLVTAAAEAERAIEESLAPYAAWGLRVTHGKQVIELRPPVDITKGTSIRELIQAHALASAIYLGDDRTDLDAFTALRELRSSGSFRGFSVAVLHPEAPPDLAAAADFTLPSAEHVPHFLRWLLAWARRTRASDASPTAPKERALDHRMENQTDRQQALAWMAGPH
jgi:trehalose 6-phosphate phosphatase